MSNIPYCAVPALEIRSCTAPLSFAHAVWFLFHKFLLPAVCTTHLSVQSASSQHTDLFPLHSPAKGWFTFLPSLWFPQRALDLVTCWAVGELFWIL